MNNQDFHSLLKRYREGKTTEEESLLIDQWYDLLGKSKLEDFKQEDLELIGDRIWNNIESGQTEEGSPEKAVPLYRRLVFRIAAAAVLTGAIFLIVFLGTTPSHTADLIAKNIDKTSHITKVNDSELPMTLHLSDGSTVQLEPSSAVTYPLQFSGDKRDVYLEGNAFFSVQRNESAPFYVHADDLVTKVLGTSFQVKTNSRSGQVEVSVRTGKVSVYEVGKDQLSEGTGRKTNNTGVVLTPNQKVTYYPKLRHFVTSLVDKPQIVSSGDPAEIDSQFSFDEQLLSTVLEKLSDTYKIDFIVENENLNNCPFTGDISAHSLFTKLDLICQSIGIDYEVKGTTILLKGKGCK